MAGARGGVASTRGSRAASRQQATVSSSSPAPPAPPATPRQPQPPPSAQASSSKEGMKTRQKRVLPTRSRRGGPGVGTCETDVMILDTMKRKAESEPLIPSTTKFLLTTNAALLPPVAESFEAELNTHAYGRYFDRPEVQRAYKAQQLIQTPEFTELPRDAHVGGRFRPRGSEDEAIDTSDAAYEKRHRKYETFEKRQRLREKEKLKHEHYKLKERIDQLRAMDSSAFLALPAADFSDAHDHSPGPSSQQEDEPPPDIAHLHGAAAYHEGERRRKEMLETALQLEQRYRTLLPPDRRWMEKKLGKPNSKAESVEVVEDEDEEELEPEDEEEPAEDDDDEAAAEDEDDEDPEAPEDDGESEIDAEEIERARSKKLKLRIKFPPRLLASKQAAAREPKPPPSRGGGKQITLSPFFKSQASGGKGGKGLANSPLRSASYTASDANSKRGRYSVDTADSLHQAPSAKRQRVHPSASAKSKGVKGVKGSKGSNGVDNSESISSAGRLYSRLASTAGPHVSYAGLAGKKEPTACVLMVAAIRQSSAPTARKTQRHVTAFGVRVPPDLEEVRDFEIPDWVLAPPGRSDDSDRQGSYEPSHTYTHGGHSDDGYPHSIGGGTDYGT
ncbi:hypothetical protein TRAPUB_12283 [Trametes pubescens]|uniref:PEHE domain-containing protein n=1 Tax=Trametes pubescens TaxID=154538 RepID=A0A1M2VUA5_TRAPU|nr:hypothetical protein TRAPUB_12283 [Trametes pubescens]